MEENNHKDVGDSRQPGQVMDVKVTPAPVESTETSEAEAAASTETNVDSSVTSATETSEHTNEHTEQAAQPLAAPSAEPPSNLPAPAAPSGRKAAAPLGVIIAAVLIALGLIAVTVYAYLQSQEKSSKSTESSQTDTTKTTPAVTGTDVDEASGEVDKALNSSEETDFPDSELTDQSLGL